jgi:hypothetical protein
VLDLLKGCYLRFQVLAVEPHKGSLISHLVAVVGCREDRQDLPPFLILEAFWFDFVRAHHHLYIVSSTY